MTQLDPDGLATFVLSAGDHGAVNWIDAGNLPQGLMLCRWQGLPPKAIRNGPSIESVIRVPASRLADHLSAGSLSVDAGARREELLRRCAAYRRRFESVV